MVSDLQWFNLGFFDVTIVWKWYAFSRNRASDFEFGFFLGQRRAVHSCLLTLGSWSTAPSPGETTDTLATLLPPDCRSVFSLSVQYSVNYMRYSTLYCEIGFVLDDLAQLRANVSVLSTSKVAWAKLWCSVGEVHSVHFLKSKFIYLFIFGCVGSLLLRAGFL